MLEERDQGYLLCTLEPTLTQRCETIKIPRLYGVVLSLKKVEPKSSALLLLFPKVEGGLTPEQRSIIGKRFASALYATKADLEKILTPATLSNADSHDNTDLIIRISFQEDSSLSAEEANANGPLVPGVSRRATELDNASTRGDWKAGLLNGVHANLDNACTMACEMAYYSRAATCNALPPQARPLCWSGAMAIFSACLAACYAAG